jgi:hypothetical protein
VSGGGVVIKKLLIIVMSSKKFRHFICHISLQLIFGFIVINVGHTQVGIGTSTPHASSILDISSSSKGLLIPRMTSAQRSAITSPSEGLMVYQTDGSKGIWIYIGNDWKIAFVSMTLGATSNSISGTGTHD